MDIWSVGSLVSIVATIVVFVAGLRHMRAARAAKTELRWITEQYDRAERMLASTDQRQQLAGLQILQAFNDHAGDMRVLSRVKDLTASDDGQVADYARETLDEIIRRIC